MIKKQRYFFLIIFLVLIIVSYFYFKEQHAQYKKITSFEECIKAGFLHISTYPEKCKLPGKVFIHPSQERESGNVTKKDALKIEDVFKNISYFIEGQKVDFHAGNGILPGSSFLKRGTSTFEISPVNIFFDVNNDTSSDIFFIVSKKDLSSNNTTLYVSGAVTLNTGYSGLNMLYVDSSPISSLILIHKDGKIAVEYTDALGAKKVKYFIFENSILKETTSQSK